MLTEGNGAKRIHSGLHTPFEIHSYKPYIPTELTIIVRELFNLFSMTTVS